jgi:hypothetical protein
MHKYTSWMFIPKSVTTITVYQKSEEQVGRDYFFQSAATSNRRSHPRVQAELFHQRLNGFRKIESLVGDICVDLHRVYGYGNVLTSRILIQPGGV